jgi:hypothetical protein
MVFQGTLVFPVTGLFAGLLQDTSLLCSPTHVTDLLVVRAVEQPPGIALALGIAEILRQL